MAPPPPPPNNSKLYSHLSKAKEVEFRQRSLGHSLRKTGPEAKSENNLQQNQPFVYQSYVTSPPTLSATNPIAFNASDETEGEIGQQYSVQPLTTEAISRVNAKSRHSFALRRWLEETEHPETHLILVAVGTEYVSGHKKNPTPRRTGETKKEKRNREESNVSGEDQKRAKIEIERMDKDTMDERR